MVLSVVDLVYSKSKPPCSPDLVCNSYLNSLCQVYFKLNAQPCAAICLMIHKPAFPKNQACCKMQDAKIATTRYMIHILGQWALSTCLLLCQTGMVIGPFVKTNYIVLHIHTQPLFWEILWPKTTSDQYILAEDQIFKSVIFNHFVSSIALGVSVLGPKYSLGQNLPQV